MLIAFEGIDGSGKSTLVQMLSDELNRIGHLHVRVKNPGTTELGKELRKIVFETITTHALEEGVFDYLMLADHIQTTRTVVAPALAKNKTVLCDRTPYSQLAYGQARGVSEDIQDQFRKHFGPKPDLLFLLTGDPEILLQRARSRTIETHQSAKAWNDATVMKSIQETYLKICPNAIWLDTTVLSTDQIFHSYVLPEVLKRLAHVQTTTSGKGQNVHRDFRPSCSVSLQECH